METALDALGLMGTLLEVCYSKFFSFFLIKFFNIIFFNLEIVLDAWGSIGTVLNAWG